MTINNPDLITRTDYWAFIQALASNDAALASSFFATVPDIDDPLLGRHVGLARLGRLSAHWAQREGLSADKLIPRHLTETNSSALIEFSAPSATSANPDASALEIAVAFDLEGKGFGAVRIYFATAGYLKRHNVRGRLLADEDGLQRYHSTVERYQVALRSSQLEDLLAQISPTARVRAGDSPTSEGKEEVRAFFTGMFETGGGGFHLEHARVFEDDESTVLEFTATRWGAHYLAPQSGVAIYTVDKNNLISDIRIYDEISPVTPVADLSALELALEGGTYKAPSLAES